MSLKFLQHRSFSLVIAFLVSLFILGMGLWMDSVAHEFLPSNPETVRVSSHILNFIAIRTLIFRILLAVLVLTSGALVFYLLRLPAKLKHVVEKATRELKVSEANYKALIENSLDMIQVINFENKVLYQNAQFEKTTGFTFQEMQEMDSFKRLHPDDRERCLQLWKEATSGKSFSGIEYRWQAKDGRWIDFLANASSVEFAGQKALLVVSRDVTKIKRAEEEQQKAQKLTEAISQTAPDAMLTTDAAGIIRSANPATLRIFGHKEEDLLDQSLAIIIPDYLDIVGEHPENTLKTSDVDHALHPFETVAVTAQGNKFPVEFFWGAAKIGSDCVLTIFVRDLSERRMAEESLHEHSLMLSNVKDAMLAVNLKGEIVYWNSGAAEIFEIGTNEILGRPLAAAVSLKLSEKLQTEMGNLLAGQEFSCEWEDHRESGESFWLDIRASLMCDAYKIPRGMLVVARDITERKHLENQLLQSQKMEAIGTLAGGIAHDFNNLLTGILGNTTLALMDLKQDTPLHSMLSQVVKAAQRGTDLTRQLLGFSRQGLSQIKKPIKVNDCVDEVINLLRRALDPRIEIHTEPTLNLWTVRGDATQINQIIMNLCVNARDAMPDGGALTLRTRNIKFSKADVRQNKGIRVGQFVCLEVSDTGHGMDKAVQEHLFEPFFTTKPVGKGTGLGLSLVYGIVKQHNGFIQLDSHVGQGTSFQIYLPRDDQEQQMDVQEDLRATFLPGNHETILVVDDDDIVRNLAGRVLTKNGFRVIYAQDGQEAIEVYQKEKDIVQVIVLDLTMPKKSGLETLTELRRMKSDVKVIVSSGNGGTVSRKELEQMEVCAFLAKPYNPNELLHEVHEAIHSRSKLDK